MAKFTPIDPKEFNQELTPGDAVFRVVNMVDTNKEGYPLRSKNNDDMINLHLLVTDCEGQTKMMFQLLVLTPKAMWKIHEFCLSIGHPEFYDEGEFTKDKLIECYGECTLRRKFDDYQGKEVVAIANFIEKKKIGIPTSDQILTAAKTAGVAAPFDDEIPF